MTNTSRQNLRTAILLATTTLFLNDTSFAAGICKTNNAWGRTEFSECSDDKGTEQSRVNLDKAPSNSYAAPKVSVQSEPKKPTAPNSVKDTEQASEKASVSDVQPDEISDKALEALLSSGLRSSKKKLDQLQEQLDASCRRARKRELDVDRVSLVMECIEGNRPKTPAECVEFYKDYGDATVRRGALYFELPECKRAFELQKRRPEHRNGRV